MNIPGIRLICRSAMCAFYTPVRNATDFRQAAIPAAIANLGKKKAKSDIGAKKSVKKEMEVETDANKLVNFVCGTDIMQGSEPIKIRPDSEYPDWLWTVCTGWGRPLRSYKYGSKQYWELVKEINIRRRIRVEKCRRLKAA